MLVVVDGNTFYEDEKIEITFADNLTRSVDAFDLILARRAIQDAIIERMTPDAEDDALDAMVYTPMFEERIVVKFDPDGLAFFIHPLKKDYQGSWADTNHRVSLEFIDDEEDEPFHEYKI